MAVITKEQHVKAKRIYELCKTGVAPDAEVKRELVSLYNEIHKTRYRPTSNCGSCLRACFEGIKKIALSDNIEIKK